MVYLENLALGKQDIIVEYRQVTKQRVQILKE